MQQVKAVIARSQGRAGRDRDDQRPRPRARRGRGAVQACGVCHTDLHYREGGINDDFPFLLGHEAAGVVEAVGPGVTEVAPGRLRHPQLARGVRAVPGLQARRAVVLLRHAQRHAEDDAGGRHRAVPGAGHRGVRREDVGRGRSVHEGRPECAAGGGRAARLRGDGGHRRRDQHRRRHARHSPSRSSAAAASAPRPIAGLGAGRREPDHRRRHRRQKLATATRLGATHTVNSSAVDPVAAIQELTGGFGADVVIEAVGRPETWKQAFYARDLAGTVVLVGVPTPDMKVPDLPLIDVFGRGGSLKSSWYGDCLPSRDFPMLVDLYQQGRLDLDAFVSEEIALTTSRRRSSKMHRGDVLRSRGDPLMAVARRSRGHLRDVQPRRRDVGRRQQRLGRR